MLTYCILRSCLTTSTSVLILTAKVVVICATIITWNYASKLLPPKWTKNILFHSRCMVARPVYDTNGLHNDKLSHPSPSLSLSPPPSLPPSPLPLPSSLSLPPSLPPPPSLSLSPPSLPLPSSLSLSFSLSLGFT